MFLFSRSPLGSSDWWSGVGLGRGQSHKQPSERNGASLVSSACHVAREIRVGGSQSSFGIEPSFGVEYSDMMALYKHVQELEDEKENLL